MDAILKFLDDCQERLYDLEDFLESLKDNQYVELLSDHWKECALGGLVAYLAYAQGKSYIQASKLPKIISNIRFQLLLQIQKQRALAKINKKREKFEEKKRQLIKILKSNATGEVMTLERETILAMKFPELVSKLKSGELDPLSVLESYQVKKPSRIRFD